jgi:hypothetical protein
MPPFEQNYKQASITLYSVVALNSGTKLERTINKQEAASVLASLLQIDRSTPLGWFRGDFGKHPFSNENLLRFVRAYGTKTGLKSPKEIRALAIHLYGRDYKRAIALLDPADRESDPAQGVLFTMDSKPNLVTAICDLIEASSPEEIMNARITKFSIEWFARNSRQGKFLM